MQVAPGLELDDHRVDIVLRPDQRLDRADLGERRRTPLIVLMISWP